MLVISLLPGTLSVRVDDGVLELHCLYDEASIDEDVHRAARQVSRLFGCEGGVR